jgi:hypothetical protein
MHSPFPQARSVDDEQIGSVVDRRGRTFLGSARK